MVLCSQAHPIAYHAYTAVSYGAIEKVENSDGTGGSAEWTNRRERYRVTVERAR